jgi:hypothetical protein
MEKQRYLHERDKLWITLYSKNAFQLIHCHMLHTIKFLKGHPLMLGFSRVEGTYAVPNLRPSVVPNK